MIRHLCRLTDLLILAAVIALLFAALAAHPRSMHEGYNYEHEIRQAESRGYQLFEP